MGEPTVEPLIRPSGRVVLTRAPGPILQPYVRTLWAVDGTWAEAPEANRRELVLPTGAMHIAFRLSGARLRLFDRPDDRIGRVVSAAVVAGARDTYYTKDVSQAVCSVGAELRPGAAEALFGMTADELTGRHVAVEELWGRDVAWMLEQLAEARMLHQRIDRLEAILGARLVDRRLHPVVSCVLHHLRPGTGIAGIVRMTGYSHRTVASYFRRSVGLTPKQYERVLRFQHALHVMAARAVPPADAALDAGYSDQAHFGREFKALAGVTPAEYRRARPEQPHHVGLAAGRR